MKLITTYHRPIEWLLGAFVVTAAFVAWSSGREPIADPLTVYELFPLFGLIAFGLMWTHFVMAALRRFAGVPLPRSSSYMTVSMGIVLAMIILHPVVLWIGLYDDGYGLPPGSHIKAYESQLLFVMLGVIGLLIFLMFELKRWFGQKTWWKLVEYAQIVGMIAIFVHAIQLGYELREGWFLMLWWLFGVSLVAAVVYSQWIHNQKGG